MCSKPTEACNIQNLIKKKLIIAFQKVHFFGVHESGNLFAIISAVRKV